MDVIEHSLMSWSGDRITGAERSRNRPTAGGITEGGRLLRKPSFIRVAHREPVQIVDRIIDLSVPFIVLRKCRPIYAEVIEVLIDQRSGKQGLDLQCRGADHAGRNSIAGKWIAHPYRIVIHRYLALRERIENLVLKIGLAKSISANRASQKARKITRPKCRCRHRDVGDRLRVL